VFIFNYLYYVAKKVLLCWAWQWHFQASWFWQTFNGWNCFVLGLGLELNWDFCWHYTSFFLIASKLYFFLLELKYYLMIDALVW